MIEKPLHTGNIAALALVATAADATFAGGLVTTIGMALSGLEVFKKADKEARTLAKSIADEVQNHLDRSHLTADRKKITVQMLALFPPTQADLAKGNMMAASVADNMRQQVKDTAKDHAHKTDTALNDYAAILTAMLCPFLEPQDQNGAMLQELLARSDKTGNSERLKDEGITENAIIRLAQRIAGETDDLGQAWLTLQDAMDTAVRVQKEGRTPSNHGDFVNQVLARVAGMAAQGDYDDASQTIAQALAEEEAAHQARQNRLLESGVELARLAGNSANAAELLVQQADLAAGGQAGFQGLRVLQTEYYETGRDKGIALDLAIAIELARLTLVRAINADQRSTAHNDMGSALATLGERESSTARLNDAVTAHKNALLEWTRERVPPHWATAQMNLGNALLALGERESGTARLNDAVTAYENALLEWARERVPLDWAMAQMNLGNALLALGERESGTARLNDAVTAYENALLERTRERVPLQWAGTQMNLGNALATLGQHESGTARLKDAVTAYENALLEWTREQVPLQWATAQMNLGNALLALGERKSGKARLKGAVIAYENALLERTRERVPLQWAMTQMNLASLELVFFDKVAGPAHLDQAMIHAKAAKEVFNEAQASQYIGMVDSIIAEITAHQDGAGG